MLIIIRQSNHPSCHNMKINRLIISGGPAKHFCTNYHQTSNQIKIKTRAYLPKINYLNQANFKKHFNQKFLHHS